MSVDPKGKGHTRGYSREEKKKKNEFRLEIRIVGLYIRRTRNNTGTVMQSDATDNNRHGEGGRERNIRRAASTQLSPTSSSPQRGLTNQ